MLYQNKEYGNVLTFEEMRKEGKELYDLFDDTNAIDYTEHYAIIES